MGWEESLALVFRLGFTFYFDDGQHWFQYLSSEPSVCKGRQRYDAFQPTRGFRTRFRHRKVLRGVTFAVTPFFELERSALLQLHRNGIVRIRLVRRMNEIADYVTKAKPAFILIYSSLHIMPVECVLGRVIV